MLNWPAPRGSAGFVKCFPLENRLTVSRPAYRSPRLRTPVRPANGPVGPRLPTRFRSVARPGCVVSMSSPASGLDIPPAALEPVLAELRGMDEDPRLASAGVGAAFAAAFPGMPDEAFLSSLTSIRTQG